MSDNLATTSARLLASSEQRNKNPWKAGPNAKRREIGRMEQHRLFLPFDPQLILNSNFFLGKQNIPRQVNNPPLWYTVLKTENYFDESLLARGNLRSNEVKTTPVTSFRFDVLDRASANCRQRLKSICLLVVTKLLLIHFQWLLIERQTSRTHS